MNHQETEETRTITADKKFQWAIEEIEKITSFIESLKSERGPKKSQDSGMRVAFIDGIHPHLGEFGEGRDFYDDLDSFWWKMQRGQKEGIRFGFKRSGESPLTLKEADITIDFLTESIASARYRILLCSEGPLKYKALEALPTGRARVTGSGAVENDEGKVIIPPYYSYEIYFTGLDKYFDRPFTEPEMNCILTAFQEALTSPQTDVIGFRLMHN